MLSKANGLWCFKSVRSAHLHHVVLTQSCSASMDSMGSPGWTYEESGALAEGTRRKTSTRKLSANPADSINKTRRFSLADTRLPTAVTAKTGSGSTQLDLTESPLHSSQDLNTSHPFFASNHPSQIFRLEAFEEEDPADPYYSPPSTFIPPESPNDMRAQEQATWAVSSSEAKVRESFICQ